MSFLFLHQMVGYQFVLLRMADPMFAGIWDTGSRKFQRESARRAVLQVTSPIAPYF